MELHLDLDFDTHFNDADDSVRDLLRWALGLLDNLLRRDIQTPPP